jgi:hypothetical protein
LIDVCWRRCIAIAALLLGLAKALCLGFFLGEMCPTLCAQPPVGAGLHATLWQPVTLTGTAKFKTHSFLHPSQAGLCFDWQTPST